MLARHRSLLKDVKGGLTMSTILAYMDPGSGSMLLQLIVGGSAGLAVFGRYVWQMLIEHVSQRRAAQAKEASA